MLKGMISNISAGLASGGTVDGDLTITGDFKVEGAGSFAYDEILEGTLDVKQGAYFNFGDNTRPTSGRTSFQGQSDLYQNSTLRGFIYAGPSVQFGTYGNIPLHLMTDNSTRATITGTGSFGIGTSSPDKTLHVSQTGTGDLAKFESTGENFSILYMADDSGTPVNYQFTHMGNKAIHYNNGNVVHASLKTGQVGIGTDSPSYKFVVNEASDHARMQIQTGSVNHQTFLQFESDRPADNDTVGNIQFRVAGNVGSSIQGFRGSGDNKGDLVFNTSDAERMRINESGNIGIGTTSPTAKLEINGGTYSSSLIIKGSASNSGISFKDSDGNTDGFIYADSGNVGFLDTDGDWAIRASANTDARLYVGGTTRVIVDANSRISLSNNDSGASNTIFGYTSGANIASGGDKNTLYGKSTGYSISTGDNNTNLGWEAGYYNATGSNNTAVGSGSMMGASGQSHSENTAVGYYALKAITTGTTNVAIGNLAGDSVTSGIQNTLVGYQAGDAITTQANNTMVGYRCGIGNTGTQNVAMGNHTFYANNSASYSVAIGGGALYAITGNYNIGIGVSAMEQHTTGARNMAIGHYTMDDTNAGANSLGSADNIFMGYD